MEAERAKLMGSGQLCQKTEDGPLKVRAFFGLPLPEAQRNLLDRYLSGCAALAPEFRWTPATNLHLTVRFLGHVEGSLAEGIAGRLADARLQAFDLKLGQVGPFTRGRLRAFDVLLRPPATDSHRADDLAVATDQDRPQARDDRYTDQAVGHAEKSRPVFGQLGKSRTVALQHRRADRLCLGDLWRERT